MLVYQHGDLLAEPAVALVNPVNCVGVMGKGLALQFKRRWPRNFQLYVAACCRGELAPGRLLVTATGTHLPRWIVNFPTKRHWRDPSRLEDIETGLQALSRWVHDHAVPSLAVPALGAGLGGLPWSEVRPLISRHLGSIPGLSTTVFEPLTSPGKLRILPSRPPRGTERPRGGPPHDR